MGKRTIKKKNDKSVKESWTLKLLAQKAGAFLMPDEPEPLNKKQHIMYLLKAACRIAGAAGAVFFLIWYFRTPDYCLKDAKNNDIALWQNGRTWFILLCGTALALLALIPNRLPEKVNRTLAWLWTALVPLAVYFSLLHLNATRFKIVFLNLNRIALVLTFVFLYMVLLFLLLVTGHMGISETLLACGVAAVGIVNWYVVSFRGQAVSAADIFSVDAAVTVANQYDFRIGWFVYSELFLTFGIALISWKFSHFPLFHWKQRVAVLTLWAVITGGYYHLCCHTSFLEDHDIRSGGFTHQLRYKQFDMLFTTLTTFFYLVVDQPDGYSIERVKEIAAPYVEPESESESQTTGGTEALTETESGQEQETAGAADAAGKKETTAGAAGTAGKTVTANTAETVDEEEKDFETPNLIVIMNESFADYTSIGQGLQLSQDCMPFIHSLTENTIKGNLYVSIFGANTPNSEYEFLTGLTMGFLPPTSVGFNLFVRGEMPSLASQLKSVGYDTIAIHPYRGYNYRRNVVYPQIGFDTYLTRDDFENPEYIRRYISDWEHSEKIIELYEQRKAEGNDNPWFCYNVTIQNHGDYFRSNSTGVPEDIIVYDTSVNRTKTSMYVNLIKKSDEMFQHITEYFSQQEEPTVIVMYGDHQAALGDNTYETLLGKEEEDLTPLERMEKYKIPFVIWANYDIEEEVVERTSLNYLYTLMADRLNLPMTGFQNYLMDMQEEIPSLSAGGYWDASGAFYELDDKESPWYDKINDYNILEYNYIFGKEKRYLKFFRQQVS